jgi:hypothetical protein
MEIDAAKENQLLDMLPIIQTDEDFEPMMSKSKKK